ncbi:MAG: hypothetical protein HDR03_00160 [Lachnospiraceae bacterium]|nr:hypothetical protein [Lachnospiraceae bacterium]
MKRIPLEKRLASATTEGQWPHAAWLYADTYFGALSEMSVNSEYKLFFMDAQESGNYGNLKDTFVAEIAAKALSDEYDPGAASRLIYQLLVKPFTDKNMFINI